MLVLESRPLEFRVLFIAVTPSSHRLASLADLPRHHISLTVSILVPLTFRHHISLTVSISVPLTIFRHQFRHHISISVSLSISHTVSNQVYFVFLFRVCFPYEEISIRYVSWYKSGKFRPQGKRSKKKSGTLSEFFLAYTVFILPGSFLAIRHHSRNFETSACFPEQLFAVSVFGHTFFRGYLGFRPCFSFWVTFHHSEFSYISVRFPALYLLLLVSRRDSQVF